MQEESIWDLKLKVNWNLEGDKNTKFFHTTTLVRRNKIKIISLRDIVGHWISYRPRWNEW